MLFFFMFSFIEVALGVLKNFSMIFIINVHLEEDLFIRREALQKVRRLLTLLEFKVGFCINLGFQMQETDKLIVRQPLSPICKGTCTS